MRLALFCRITTVTNKVFQVKGYTNYDNSVYLPGLYFSKPTKKRAKEKFLELWSFSITLVTHFRWLSSKSNEKKSLKWVKSLHVDSYSIFYVGFFPMKIYCTYGRFCWFIFWEQKELERWMKGYFFPEHLIVHDVFFQKSSHVWIILNFHLNHL